MADFKITAEHKANFETLCKAVKAGHVGLMVVNDTLTGREDIAIVAFGRDKDGNTGMTPFAMLLNVHEVCYTRLQAPNPDGGYAPLMTEEELEWKEATK